MQINKTLILEKFESFITSIIPINRSCLASFSFEIPDIEVVTLTTLNININNDFFYWKIKNEDIEFLACNPLISFNEFGEDRLTKTSNHVNKLSKNFSSNWNENNLERVPLVVGGIKFAPDQNSIIWEDFSDSDWFVPQMLFMKNQGKTYLIYNFFLKEPMDNNLIIFRDFLMSLEKIQNESIPLSSNNDILYPYKRNSFEKWEIIVNKALENISKGLLSKVVLSREVKLQFLGKPYFPDLINKLSERYPKCYTFLYKRSGSIFIGASPEKLAKVSDNWIEVDALAGSAPRGENEIQDIELENFLLSSEKNLFEQRAVVNFIHNLLSKFSDEIIFDDKPIIRKLPNIQHLWTVIKARLNDDIKMFDLMMKLHPTPAICGAPWKIAKDFILEMEPHDRGLYSGNIGWFNFKGNGEFAVGIRAALIKDNILYAYAGCGIVEGSEANSEYEESEIKLKPILSLFVNEKVYQP